MTITFSSQYKRECYDAFRYSPYINKVMESLDSGNSPNLRSYMDASIDDLQNEINQPIGNGEHSIHNSRVQQLRLMYSSWYKLFELLESQDTTEYELLPNTSN
jgi:deoxyadenosine/deoxycytidine kinase